MSFISFKKEDKEIIINTDRIISVEFNSENGKTKINCTDQFTIFIDETEDDLRRRLGVKKGERTIGFGSI